MNELCFVHSMANNVSQGNALSVVLFVYTSTSLLEVVTQYGLKREINQIISKDAGGG